MLFTVFFTKTGTEEQFLYQFFTDCIEWSTTCPVLCNEKIYFCGICLQLFSKNGSSNLPGTAYITFKFLTWSSREIVWHRSQVISVQPWFLQTCFLFVTSRAGLVLLRLLQNLLELGEKILFSLGTKIEKNSASKPVSDQWNWHRKVPKHEKVA